MSRLLDLGKGLLAVAASTALLVGVPYALVVLVGEPITDLRQLATGELLSDDTRVTLALRSGLTVIAWIAWLQIAASFVIETVALARGRVAGRAPVLPGVQGLARRLVVTSALLLNAASTTPASVAALMPLAVPPPIESVELEVLRSAEPDISGQELGVDTGTVRYTAAAGDTFWSVAEALLGDGLRWHEIREANLGRTMPDGSTITAATEVVRAGWELALPPDAVLPAVEGVAAEGEATVTAGDEPEAAPQDAPTPTAAASGSDQGAAPLTPSGEVIGTWDVERGDHFWAIADETLTTTYGRPATEDEIRPYWLAVIEANRDRLVTGDPDLIHPGQTFDVLLPPLPAELRIQAEADLGPIEGEGGYEPGVIGDASPQPAPSPEWTAIQPPQDPRGLLPLDAPAEVEPATVVDPATVGLGVLGTAIGGGALLQLLRTRRRLAATRRRPGTVVEPPSDAAAHVEARIRPVADTEAVRWLTAANRYLTQQLSLRPAGPLPAVLAMRAGDFGVEVLLDEASTRPDGFVDGGGGGAAWRLHPDADLDALEAGSRTVYPYCPALLPVGETEAGDLLVDLEQLGVLSVGGDLATVSGWMATLATGATTMSWSQPCPVVAVGVGTVDRSSSQVVVPSDPDRWVDLAVAELGAEARLRSSPYRQRVDADELRPPTIVLLGPGHDDLARRLAEVAAEANAALVVVTTTDLPGHARVELRPDHGVLVPDATGLRLEFTPVLTGSDTIHLAARVLDEAGRVAPDSDRLADVAETVRRRPVSAVDEELLVPDHWPPPPLPTTERSVLAAAPEPEPHADAPVEVDVPGASDPRATLDGSSVVDDPASTRPDVAASRQRILEPRPIETRILTPEPTLVGGEQLSPRMRAIVLYLAAVAEATTAQLLELFWPPGTDGSAVEGTMAEIGVLLGRGADGAARLHGDGQTGRWTLGDDVGSDWRRATALVELADDAPEPQAEMSCLEAALELVDGRPGPRARSDELSWLHHDYGVYGAIETLLVDVAYRLGDLALVHGRPKLASWAAGQGLLVVPGQEALHRIQMKAAALLDDSDGVEASYRAALTARDALVPSPDLQPETTDLYAKLTGE